MMNKKYKLCEDDTIVRDGRKLYRLQALREFRQGVKAGDLGGYVEKEANLSQEGTCWLFGKACAYEDARVEGDAMMHGHATIRGKAKLLEEARVFEQAIVQGEAKIGGESVLHDQVVVGGKAEVQGRVILYGFVHVGESARVEGSRRSQYLVIEGTTMLLGDTVIEGYGGFPEKDAILEAGSFQVEAYA